MQPSLENEMMGSSNPKAIADFAIFHSSLPYSVKKEWLYEFIHDEFGVKVPKVACCPNHCSPLDFVADVVFQQVQSALAVANRDGGKTYDFAIIHALNSLFYDKCESLSVGAVESQAKKCYSYFKQFIKAEAFQGIYNSPNIERTELLNESVVQVVPGTTNALNSPHTHKAAFDEVELTKWDALQEFFSISKSDESLGLKATDILGSTRKYSYGVIQQLMDAIESGSMHGWKIYMWCIWEVTKPFELREEWKKIIKRDKDGKEVTFYDAAAPYAGKTDGFYPIDDVVKKFSTMSYETWVTQWECKAPSKEGLIYGSEFDERDVLAQPWQYNSEYAVFAGQDFGDNNPMTTLFYQLIPVEEAGDMGLGTLPPDGYVLVLFDEVYINKMSGSNYTKTYLIPRQYQYNVEYFAHDPSGAGFAREFSEAHAEGDFDRKLQVMIPSKLTVEEGIQLVKTMHEEHRIKVSPNCVNYRREKKSYHYIPDTDKPAKEYDHTQDAERYVLWKLFGRKEESKPEAYGPAIMLGSSSRHDDV